MCRIWRHVCDGQQSWESCGLKEARCVICRSTKLIEPIVNYNNKKKQHKYLNFNSDKTWRRFRDDISDEVVLLSPEYGIDISIFKSLYERGRLYKKKHIYFVTIVRGWCNPPSSRSLATCYHIREKWYCEKDGQIH